MKKIRYFAIATMTAGLVLTTPMAYSQRPAAMQVSQEDYEVKSISTLKQLENIVANNKCVAVNFGVTFYHECKSYNSIFESVAKEYKEVMFCKVDLDPLYTWRKEKPKTLLEMAEKYEVMRIPKTVLFKDGKEVYNCEGTVEKGTLNMLIETFLLGEKIS